MSYTFKILAEVIDIRSFNHIQDKKYFVDTNVWYWTTYATGKKMPEDNSPNDYQINEYPNFISEALDNNCQLYHCSLNIAEIAHLIENIEHKIFCDTKVDDSLKNFRRKRPTERERVVNEILQASNGISSMSNLLDLNLNSNKNSELLDSLSKQCTDFYDSAYVDLMKNNDIPIILTDDADFASVKGIKVYTANDSLIRQAENQKRLREL